jgi:two-component system response regulator MprA
MLELPEEEADAMIVDVGPPDADGRDLVQALRARGTTAPVIFLTARDALPDRLAGFCTPLVEIAEPGVCS